MNKPLPVNLTDRFRPLKEWPDITPKYHSYMFERNEQGVYNAMLHQEVLNSVAGNSHRADKMRIRFGARPLHSFRRENNLWCHPDANLPAPKRGDYSYGLSRVAWVRAAMYAGAGSQSFSLKTMGEIADSAIDYRLDIIDKCSDDPVWFSAYMNEIARSDFLSHQESKIIRSEGGMPCYLSVPYALALRMIRMYEDLITWSAIGNSIKRLQELKMSGGRQARVEVYRQGPIRDEFLLLRALVVSLCDSQNQSIKIVYASGLGYDFAKMFPRLKTADGFLIEVDISTNLFMSQLRKTSYFDAVLAGLCGYTSNTLFQELQSFAHLLLEYEQTLQSDPTLGEKMSEHLQQMIAMTFDMILLLEEFDKKEGPIAFDPIKNPKHFKNWEQSLSQLTNLLFVENDITNSLSMTGEVTPRIARAFKDRWNKDCIDIYGQNFDDHFGVNEIRESRRSKWLSKNRNPDNLSNSLNDLSNSGVTVTPLAKSGHAYRLEKRMNIERLSPSTEEAEPEDRFIPTTKFKVNNKQIKLMKKLFSTASEIEGQGQMRWDDIYKLMRRLGFSIGHVGSSVIRFVPPANAGTPFNEHRPHPETSISSIRYRAFGERLKRNYGCNLDWFERVSTVDD